MVSTGRGGERGQLVLYARVLLPWEYYVNVKRGRLKAQMGGVPLSALGGNARTAAERT